MNSKEEMTKCYLTNPLKGKIIRNIDNDQIEYFYFNEALLIKAKSDEIINGCLLEGETNLKFQNKQFSFNRFDLFFMPPNSEIAIDIKHSELNNKICIFRSKLIGPIEAKFELQKFSFDKFIPRGELGSNSNMATYRKVWTAIMNGYFMSGFTSIPSEVLSHGVITSVNLEENKDKTIEIYPHIHPEFPELYIFCIDDDNYAVTQYLINSDGQSVAKDLVDGEGLFFPGYLGHANFAKPTNKQIKFCLYLWIIPTYGKTDTIKPITLRV